jgi:hypothetical protein
VSDDQDFDDDDFDPDDPSVQEPPARTVTLSRKQIRSLEAKAARADAAERELAFAKAGVDLADPKLSYFVKGYSGELTPEAIKQEAVNAGFLAAPQASSSDDAARDEELDAHDQLGSAAAGASSSDKTDLGQKMREAFAAEGQAGVLRVYREAGLPVADAY